MHLNERYREEHMKVVLENGIDFKESDCKQFFDNTFEIKEEKLSRIAKSIGFDECVRCSKLKSITQEYVNAEFIRYL